MPERTENRNVVAGIPESTHKMAYVHAGIVPHAILFAMEPGEELTKAQILARVNESLGVRFSPATFTRSYFELQIAQLIEKAGEKLRLTPLATEAREAYKDLVGSLAEPFKDRLISQIEAVGEVVPADSSIFSKEYLREVFETFWDERRLALLASLDTVGETNRADLSRSLDFPYNTVITIIGDLAHLGFVDVDRRTVRMTELGTKALQAFQDYAQRLQKPSVIELIRQTERGFNLEPGTLTSASA